MNECSGYVLTAVSTSHPVLDNSTPNRDLHFKPSFHSSVVFNTVL